MEKKNYPTSDGGFFFLFLGLTFQFIIIVESWKKE